MTYRDKLQEFHQEFLEKSDVLMKLHNELIFVDGFADINLVPDYQNAYLDWQIASNNFHSFFAYTNKLAFDLDVEYPIK